MTTGSPALARRAAVLGHPVGHSLSPALHEAAYAHLGLVGWTYGRYDVEEDRLAGFLDGLDASWAGLSLTMPLKAAVLPLLDEISPLVAAVGGANTVLLREGRRLGANTDVPGMVAALAARGVTSVERAVVLGGGATARSAVAALGSLTAEVTVYVRDPARVPGLEAVAGSALALTVAPWGRAAEGLAAPLVVAAAASGATDGLAGTVLVPGQGSPPIGSPRQAPLGVLLEVLYEPWPTRLAAAWAARGGTVVDGLDLLVHQAVLQVGLMTGVGDDGADLAAVLRRTGERALAR